MVIGIYFLEPMVMLLTLCVSILAIIAATAKFAFPVAGHTAFLASSFYSLKPSCAYVTGSRTLYSDRFTAQLAATNSTLDYALISCICSTGCCVLVFLHCLACGVACDGEVHVLHSATVTALRSEIFGAICASTLTGKAFRNDQLQVAVTGCATLATNTIDEAMGFCRSTIGARNNFYAADLTLAVLNGVALSALRNALCSVSTQITPFLVVIFGSTISILPGLIFVGTLIVTYSAVFFVPLVLESMSLASGTLCAITLCTYTIRPSVLTIIGVCLATDRAAGQCCILAKVTASCKSAISKGPGLQTTGAFIRTSTIGTIGYALLRPISSTMRGLTAHVGIMLEVNTTRGTLETISNAYFSSAYRYVSIMRTLHTTIVTLLCIPAAGVVTFSSTTSADTINIVMGLGLRQLYIGGVITLGTVLVCFPANCCTSRCLGAYLGQALVCCGNLFISSVSTLGAVLICIPAGCVTCSCLSAYLGQTLVCCGNLYISSVSTLGTVLICIPADCITGYGLSIYLYDFMSSCNFSLCYSYCITDAALLAIGLAGNGTGCSIAINLLALIRRMIASSVTVNTQAVLVTIFMLTSCTARLTVIHAITNTIYIVVTQSSLTSAYIGLGTHPTIIVSGETCIGTSSCSHNSALIVMCTLCTHRSATGIDDLVLTIRTFCNAHISNRRCMS